MADIFLQRKKDVLSKKDKSFIGKWDEKIIPLCRRINSFDDYYTTSSCSGRIMIIRDMPEKSPGLFAFVSHNRISLKDFLKKIPESKKDFKFKQEPAILHVACRNLESAEKFLDKARSAGFKRAGIISLKKNIIVEVIGTEKIEFPLIKNGKLLADREFLRIVLEKSNKNLEKNWKKIEKLRKSI